MNPLLSYTICAPGGGIAVGLRSGRCTRLFARAYGESERAAGQSLLAQLCRPGKAAAIRFRRLSGLPGAEKQLLEARQRGTGVVRSIDKANAKVQMN